MKEPSSSSTNRKPKPTDTPTPYKKLNHRQPKSIKRNLSSAFTPITEDDDDTLNPSENQSTVEIGKSSLISDQVLVSKNVVVLQRSDQQAIGVSSAFVSNEDRLTESVEKHIVSSKKNISPASTTSELGESTPSSSPSTSLVTAEAAAALVVSVPHDEATTEDIMNSFNIQSMVNELRGSMCQVLNSDDLDLNYKKLFDALVKILPTEELHSVHKEKDLMSVFFVLLSFVLAVIVAGLVGFFLFSDARNSYHGPPPT